jgi:hypothetical protein
VLAKIKRIWAETTPTSRGKCAGAGCEKNHVVGDIRLVVVMADGKYNRKFTYCNSCSTNFTGGLRIDIDALEGALYGENQPACRQCKCKVIDRPPMRRNSDGFWECPKGHVNKSLREPVWPLPKARKRKK